MVRSIIKPLDVNYNEYRKIDQEDIDYTTFVYETNLFDKDIEIVLGNEKHNYSKHDILHFSIYLIIDESPVSRIGIFEIDNNKYLNSIDEDGSIDLEKGELIFFIEKEELSKLINVQSSDDKNEDIKKESDNEDYVMTNDDYEDLTDNNSNDNDLMRVKIEPNNKRESSKISKNDNDLFSYDEKQEVLPLLDEESEKESDKYKSEYKCG